MKTTKIKNNTRNKINNIRKNVNNTRNKVNNKTIKKSKRNKRSRRQNKQKGGAGPTPISNEEIYRLLQKNPRLLIDKGLSLDNLNYICNKLKDNDLTITRLYFYGNKIGDIGAKALADALENNNKLIELDLNYNEIGMDGAKAITDLLKKKYSP